MVARKNRYIVIRFHFEEERKISLESTLLAILKDKMKENFGEYGLCKIYNMALLLYLPYNQVAIIKVDVDACKDVLFMILTCGRINSLKCSFNTVCISGIYKKALKKIQKEVESEKKS